MYPNVFWESGDVCSLSTVCKCIPMFFGESGDLCSLSTVCKCIPMFFGKVEMCALCLQCASVSKCFFGKWRCVLFVYSVQVYPKFSLCSMAVNMPCLLKFFS